jgi:hypothetical protein
LKHLLHVFDDEGARRLLAQCRRAMIRVEGSELRVVEAIRTPAS